MRFTWGGVEEVSGDFLWIENLSFGQLQCSAFPYFFIQAMHGRVTQVPRSNILTFGSFTVWTWPIKCETVGKLVAIRKWKWYYFLQIIITQLCWVKIPETSSGPHWAGPGEMGGEPQKNQDVKLDQMDHIDPQLMGWGCQNVKLWPRTASAICQLVLLLGNLRYRRNWR